MKTILILFGAAFLIAVPAMAQTTTVTTTTTTTATASSASDAVKIAKDGVDPTLRDHVVSVYGVGRPSAIQTWWVIFYDGAVASHGRAVKVENGRITKTYEAKSGVVYDSQLTFAPAQVTGDGSALAAAQDYAAKHAIAYDSVRVLLRNTTTNQAFRWRVELMNGAANKGFVFSSAADGAFVMYSPPGSEATHTGASTGGVAGDVEHAANKVKSTFLGIGGDLQEFFTGDRTVDQ